MVLQRIYGRKTPWDKYGGRGVNIVSSKTINDNNSYKFTVMSIRLTVSTG